MNQSKTKRPIDIYLLIPIVFLSLIGLMMVYSASNVIGKEVYNDSFYFFKKQFVFYIIGLILSVIIILLDINILKKYTTIIFIISLLLLLALFIPGVGSSKGGATSWIDFKVFSIQPSEFMKGALILVYAKYLSNNANDLKNFKYFLMFLSLSALIFAIIMLQPDFGTALVILITSLVMMFLSGAKIKHFLIIAFFGVLLFSGLIIAAPYRLERITAFLNPWNDPLGSGFQGIQSLYAITPGGIFGHGFNSSMQKHFFLPEPQNDFIFAIYVEEFGLIGAIILISLYLIIFIRSIHITMHLDELYYKYLALGLCVSFILQIIINIYVVIGLLPVTGITLPLMSYGGSSLIITMITLAILLNISKYRSYEIK